MSRKSKSRTRFEHDLLGDLPVPADALLEAISQAIGRKGNGAS
jgi:hypothetical protein